MDWLVNWTTSGRLPRIAVPEIPPPSMYFGEPGERRSVKPCDGGGGPALVTVTVRDSVELPIGFVTRRVTVYVRRE